MAIRFGTDGWRAIISDEFTFENVRRVAKAIADYLIETKGPLNGPVVVGFDTRFLSDRYAKEVARCLASNGLSVYLSKSDCPSPALAYAIRSLGALGGVMITASHNPPRYNGIKLKSRHGGPAMPEDTERVEQILVRNQDNEIGPRTNHWALLDDLGDRAGITRFDPMEGYLAQVRQVVDIQAIGAAGLRVAVDPMYGAGRGYTAALLREAGCEVVELHGEMNPGFAGIHPEPIERNLGELMATMRTGRYDIGLATDGDADRLGAVDAGARFVDPHRIFSLILHHLIEERGGTGAVVKTVSTTQLLNRLTRHYSLPLHETPVGFNHICAWLLKEDVLMAGEESGGMTIKGHIPDGDGILMGLLLLEVVATRRVPLSDVIQQLMQEFGEFHYGRDDVQAKGFDKKVLTERLTREAPDRILSHQVAAVNSRDGVKYILDDDSWILIRPSGTEPVLRIYAEARTRQEVPELLAAGARLAHVG
jgi:alpha-D-glucose phosphate-specific phosphoglucomutase